MKPIPLTIKGQTMSITEWSKAPGAARYNTIVKRLATQPHISHEEAVFGTDRRGRVVRKRFRRIVEDAPVRPVEPRQATAYRPAWGYCRTFPLEALDVLRRV